MGPLLFLIYINDLSLSVNKLANPILFADDTTIIITNANPDEFQKNISSVMTEITSWFQSNLLSLNYNKTHFMQFQTKKQNEGKFQILVPNSINSNINGTKFLCLIIDNSLSWKDHITSITSILNKACSAIRLLKPFLTINTLRMIYFSYAHSILSYGIIFWGNSHAYHTNSIFKIQKRIIRIITNSGSHDTCHQLFKQFQILSLPSQYILSPTVFVIKNRDFFQTNSEIHNLNTHFNRNLHLTSTNLTSFQKGVLFSGSKIYNYLPSNIKALSDDAKRFKSALKKYLIEHSFYSLDEFYQSAS